MFCTKCGAKLAPDAKFCVACGQAHRGTTPAAAPAPSVPVPSAPKKRRAWPLVVSLVAAVAIIAVLGVVFVPGLMKPAEPISYIFLTEMDETYLMTQAGKKLKIPDDITIYGIIQSSADSAAVAFLTNPRQEGEQSVDLWVVTAKEAKLVDSGVSCFLLAGGGNALLYAKDGLLQHSDLYTYDVSKGKSKPVVEDALYGNYYGQLQNAAISPNGRYVAASNSSAAGVSARLYKDGKKVRDLDERYIAVMVSDKANVLSVRYADGATMGLAAPSMQIKDDIIDFGEQDEKLYLNADMTQALYERDGKTYLWEQGGEPMRVAGALLENSEFYPPEGTRLQSTQVSWWYPGIIRCGAKDLRDGIITDGDRVLYRFVANGDAEKVAPDIRTAAITGSNIYYLDYVNSLYILNNRDKSAVGEEVAREVAEYRPVAKTGGVYYIDAEGTMFYADGKGNHKRVAYDASSIEVPRGGAKCYFMVKAKGDTACELYYGDADSKQKIDDEVEKHFVCGSNVYYLKANGALYFSAGGKPGKRVLNGVDAASAEYMYTYLR